MIVQPFNTSWTSARCEKLDGLPVGSYHPFSGCSSLGLGSRDHSQLPSVLSATKQGPHDSMSKVMQDFYHHQYEPTANCWSEVLVEEGRLKPPMSGASELVVSVQIVFNPEGPGTWYLRFLVPKPRRYASWFLGPDSLNVGYLDPLGRTFSVSNGILQELLTNWGGCNLGSQCEGPHYFAAIPGAPDFWKYLLQELPKWELTTVKQGMQRQYKISTHIISQRMPTSHRLSILVADSFHLAKGPKDHINTRISHSGSKAQHKGETRNPVF